jgi:hypothetical protein
MAHNLIVNYGLDKKMDIIRPEPASAHSMTAFHTDEYIDFLTRVTPETLEVLTGKQTRCAFAIPLHLVGGSTKQQISLERIVRHSKACSSSAPSRPEARYVRLCLLPACLLTPASCCKTFEYWPSGNCCKLGRRIAPCQEARSVRVSALFPLDAQLK